MPNQPTADLIDDLRNTSALQRSIGLATQADMLERAASTISDLDAALAVERAIHRHPAGSKLTARRITEAEEAFALRAGAVVVNDPGKAFQIKPRPEAASGYIDHATAAWLLPLTVVHEGDQ